MHKGKTLERAVQNGRKDFCLKMNKQFTPCTISSSNPKRRWTLTRKYINYLGFCRNSAVTVTECCNDHLCLCKSWENQIISEFILQAVRQEAHTKTIPGLKVAHDPFSVNSFFMQPCGSRKHNQNVLLITTEAKIQNLWEDAALWDIWWYWEQLQEICCRSQ